MARYLVIDLADEFKAEADRLSKGEMDAIDKVLHLERELNEKADEMNDLITKERQSNDELQRVRRELIKGLNDILRGNHDSISIIGIKNVGEIDSKVFISEMEKRFFSLECAAIKGVELCSLWQEKLKNPQWHPYRIIEDETGKAQRLVKEDDPSLQDLKKEWGQEVHDAVVVAMNELQEYNPSGCYVVPELWNFYEDRKANLDEVISYILQAVKDVFETRSISQIYKCKERMYNRLQISLIYNVRDSFGGLKCPFCIFEKNKDYNYLLRHALTVAEGSSESARQRGNHLALAKYLVIDLHDMADAVPQSTTSSPPSESGEEDDEIVEESWDMKYKKALDAAEIMCEKSDARTATPPPPPRRAASKPPTKRTVTTSKDPGSSSRPPTKRTRTTSKDPGSSSKPPTKRTRTTSKDPGSSSRPPTKRTRKTSEDPGSSSRKSKGQT